METKSSEMSVGNLNLADKVASREVITTVIGGDRISLYLNAGLASGYGVKVIAEEGEEFPHVVTTREGKVVEDTNGKYDGEKPRLKVSNIVVQGKGYKAIAIEKPEGSKSFEAFWKKFDSLQQGRVQPSPNTTVKL